MCIQSTGLRWAKTYSEFPTFGNTVPTLSVWPRKQVNTCLEWRESLLGCRPPGCKEWKEVGALSRKAVTVLCERAGKNWSGVCLLSLSAERTPLVVQRLRILLPMQETRVWGLAWGDSQAAGQRSLCTATVEASVPEATAIRRPQTGDGEPPLLTTTREKSKCRNKDPA